MAESIAIRPATVHDAEHIAHHRAQMFIAMGQLSGDAIVQLQRETCAYLQTALPSGEYVGWLARAAGDPEQVVGGAGVQRRRVLPHPSAGRVDRIAEGRHAIVLNVFTEPEWRRQGIAERLMQAIVEWARKGRLDRLVLHASEAGRPLYERLGFVATNEMRFAALLD